MSNGVADYARYKELKLSFSEGICTVTLSNPGKRNAATPGMSAELVTIWEDLWQDDDVKIIIVTGEGADFCSGVDLTGAAQRLTAPAARPVNPVTRNARKHVMGILDCEKPVLAKVRGVAYGLGVNVALACDMVFASKDARFCDSHVKMGMAAGDGGVLLWPLLCGMHRAKQYLLTGDPVAADKAAEIGLINEVLPDDELDAYVQKMAEKLRDLPPHAVNYTKASLNFALKQMTSAAFEASLAYEIYTMRTPDFLEASAAFKEKRPGRFKGA